MQNTFKYLCLLLLFTSCSLAAQKAIRGDGNVQEEVRDIIGFDGFSVGSGIDVYLTQGSDYAVKVVADQNLLPHFRTELKGSTLHIGMKGWINNAKKLEVYLTLPQLNYIQASGGSDIHGQSLITAPSLRIQTSGGSDTNLELAVEELDCQMSGGSDAELKGQVTTLLVQASGGSDLKASSLTARNANVQTSGGSDVHIRVTNDLQIQASGSSDVYYHGDPKQVKANTSGGADVSKI